MSRIWNPTTKLLIWAVIGLGAVIIALEGLLTVEVDGWKVFRGAIFVVLSVINIRYALNQRRERNAQD